MPIYIPSQQELDEQRGGAGDFSLLEEDDYLLELKELKVTTKDPDKYHKEKYLQGQAKFAVISTSNGEPAIDVDGEEVSDRLLWDWLELERIGFAKNGTPSKTRQFIAGCQSANPREPIELDEWDDLVEKRVIGTVGIKPKPDGTKRNVITGYKAAVRRRPAKKTETPAPKADDLDLTKEAKDIFGGEDEDF